MTVKCEFLFSKHSNLLRNKMLRNLQSSPNINGMISDQGRLNGRYMWHGTPAEEVKCRQEFGEETYRKVST